MSEIKSPALAGFGSRLYAYLIDQTIIQTAAIAIFALLNIDAISKTWQAYTSILNAGSMAMTSFSNNAGPLPPSLNIDEAMTALLTFAIQFTALSVGIGLLYGTLMEGSASGATLGKRHCGLCVTTEGGGRIGYVSAFLRNIGINLYSICATISVEVFVLVTPLYLTPLFMKKRQALYDLAIRAIVVKR